MPENVLSLGSNQSKIHKVLASHASVVSDLALSQVPTSPTPPGDFQNVHTRAKSVQKPKSSTTVCQADPQ